MKKVFSVPIVVAAAALIYLAALRSFPEESVSAPAEQPPAAIADDKGAARAPDTEPEVERVEASASAHSSQVDQTLPPQGGAVAAQQAKKLLDRMATRPLPTEAELEALQSTANSPVFQSYLFAVLSGSKEFVFDFDLERARFIHQDYLKDVYRYGNASTRERIAEELEAMIFSTSYLDTPDMKLRQSLAGDKVDYLRFTRDNYPALFVRMKDRIEAMEDPLLTFCLSEV